MKIGVTGPRGRLGSELVRQGCVPINADVTNPLNLQAALMDLKPEVIIHCAAKTNVDMCEFSPVTTTEVNVGGACSVTALFRGPVVYISTDYVFDGEAGPYTEEDKPNPISVYGWSKLGGEIVLKNRHNPDDLIIRTTVLFDNGDNNFVTRIAKKLLDGETIQLPDKLFGSPTYVPHLAEAILAAIDKNVSGILNLAGDWVMSRFDLGQHVARLLDIPAKNIERGEVTGRAPRPLQAGLILDKAKKIGLPIYDPSIGVREVLDALEKMATGRPHHH